MPRVSRRAAILSGSAALALGLAGQGARGQAPRPNILWLVSEDNSPLIGAYGDRLARTPHIDALAAKGLLYRNVYSNAPVCAPSRFAILTGVHPESCAPANHMRAVAKLPEAIRGYPEFLRQAGYYCSNNDKTDYNCDADPARLWDDSGRGAHWRNRPPGQPFMAVFNIGTTHESRLFQPTPGPVRPADVRVPAYLPDTPDIRTDIASYYNLIEKMDGEVGARLAELEAAGLAEDTIVFYYSDNGGVLPRSKRYCYDEGLRCALVVRIPARWAHLAPAPPGSTVETPVSFVDLAPTLLSLTGQRAPAVMQGTAFLGIHAASPKPLAFGMRDRMDERYDMVRTVTDGRFRYLRNYTPHRPWGQHQAFAWLAKGYQSWEREHLAGRLTPAQARFFGPKPFEELYDLAHDPDEGTDLAADARYAPQLQRLRRALDAHMLEINDNGFIPEGLAPEGYLPSRAPGAYPLRRLMALASAAARRDARKTGLFRAALADADPVVRYWGAMGLLLLGEAGRAGQAELEAAMHGDPVPQVRVVAAEAVGRLGSPPVAAAVLAALLDESHPWPVRLQALNALTALGEAAQPALPAIKRAAQSDQEYIGNAGRYLEQVLEGRYRPESAIFDIAAMMRKFGQP